jgi:hypothetical protein
MKASQNKFAVSEKQTQKKLALKIENQDYKMMCMC